MHKKIFKGLILNRRSFFQNLWVHPRFQIRFLSYIIAASSVIILALYISKIYLFYSWNLMMDGLSVQEGLFLKKILTEQHNMFEIVYVGLYLFVFVFLLIGGVYLSSRIIGPLERLRAGLDEAKKGGDIETIRFRNNDFFTELADSYNACVKVYKKTVKNKSS